MSRPRERRVLVWSDEAGNEYREVTRTPARGALLSTLPVRLVDAYCPARHLIASLVPNGDAPPLVYTSSPGHGPEPFLVLLPGGGLCAAHVSPSTGTVSALGTPRARFGVDCATCRLTHEMRADEMRRAASAGGGKTRRLGLSTTL